MSDFEIPMKPAGSGSYRYEQSNPLPPMLWRVPTAEEVEIAGYGQPLLLPKPPRDNINRRQLRKRLKRAYG